MIISPDDLLAPGPRTRETVGEAWAEARRRFRALLPDVEEAWVMVGIPGSGKSTWARANDRPGLVIFDACWARAKHRQAVARQVRAQGVRPVAAWVRTPLDLARARNENRPASRRVPDVALTRAWVQLRHHPPTRAEGWAEVRIIQPAAGGGPGA